MSTTSESPTDLAACLISQMLAVMPNWGTEAAGSRLCWCPQTHSHTCASLCCSLPYPTHLTFDTEGGDEHCTAAAEAGRMGIERAACLLREVQENPSFLCHCPQHAWRSGRVLRAWPKNCRGLWELQGTDPPTCHKLLLLKWALCQFVPTEPTPRNQTKNSIRIIFSLMKVPSSSQLIFLSFTFILCLLLFHVPLIFSDERDSAFTDPPHLGLDVAKLNLPQIPLQSEVNRALLEGTGLCSRAGRKLYFQTKSYFVFLAQ